MFIFHDRRTTFRRDNFRISTIPRYEKVTKAKYQATKDVVSLLTSATTFIPFVGETVYAGLELLLEGADLARTYRYGSYAPTKSNYWRSDKIKQRNKALLSYLST